MKHLIALFFLFSLNAEASYFANHCSDSYGSVRWETGHNSNQLFYKIGEEVVKKVDFHKLEVKFDKEMVVREVNIHRCGFMSRTKVTVATAIITPANEFPNALDFLDGEKKIEAEVLCTNHMNSRAPCPEKQ
jgi:hypothetical protein